MNILISSFLLGRQFPITTPSGVQASHDFPGLDEGLEDAGRVLGRIVDVVFLKELDGIHVRQRSTHQSVNENHRRHLPPVFPSLCPGHFPTFD